MLGVSGSTGDFIKCSPVALSHAGQLDTPEHHHTHGRACIRIRALLAEGRSDTCSLPRVKLRITLLSARSLPTQGKVSTEPLPTVLKLSGAYIAIQGEPRERVLLLLAGRRLSMPGRGLSTCVYKTPKFCSGFFQTLRRLMTILGKAQWLSSNLCRQTLREELVYL